MNHNEQEVQMSLMLAALGNESRLCIYRLLVRAGHEGLPVGKIQESLGIPGSTLSHHLAALKHGGLIMQRKEGRIIFSCANYDTMDELVNYLTDECCIDAKDGARK